MEFESIEEVNPSALVAVEELSQYFKQDAVADHDPYGKIRWAWQFEHKGESVEVHMLRSLNDKYALAVADFGRDGVYANEWTKKNKGHFKAAKSILLRTLKTDFFGELISGKKD